MATGAQGTPCPYEEEIAALDRYYETTEITFRPAPNNRSYSGLAAACTPADPSNDEEHAPLEEAAADGIDAEEDVPRNLRDDESKCGWHYPDGRKCGRLISYNSCKAHLRDYHGVHGAPSLRIDCCWCQPPTKRSRHNIGRHVQEAHLHFSR